MGQDVDQYFEKATRWREESEAVRAILLDCGLDEAIKWGKPTYASGGNNLCIQQKFKGFLALLFFKGALLEDPDGLLKSQGENTRSALRLEFTDVGQVTAAEAAIRDFVAQAIEVEAKGLKVEKPELELVPELLERFERDPALKEAFEGLTPGRQRAYNLYFGGAKQSETRARRIEKYAEKILEGKGFRD